MLTIRMRFPHQEVIANAEPMTSSRLFPDWRSRRRWAGRIRFRADLGCVRLLYDESRRPDRPGDPDRTDGRRLGRPAKPQGKLGMAGLRQRDPQGMPM